MLHVIFITHISAGLARDTHRRQQTVQKSRRTKTGRDAGHCRQLQFSSLLLFSFHIKQRHSTHTPRMWSSTAVAGFTMLYAGMLPVQVRRRSSVATSRHDDGSEDGNTYRHFTRSKSPVLTSLYTHAPTLIQLSPKELKLTILYDRVLPLVATIDQLQSSASKDHLLPC